MLSFSFILIIKILVLLITMEWLINSSSLFSTRQNRYNFELTEKKEIEDHDIDVD